MEILKYWIPFIVMWAVIFFFYCGISFVIVKSKIKVQDKLEGMGAKTELEKRHAMFFSKEGKEIRDLRPKF